MAIPALILGVILSTLYGTVFHLIFSGSARRFLLYLLAAWTGFGVGHWAGDFLGIQLYRVGALNVLTATLGAFIAMGIALWLAEADLTSERYE